MRNPGFGLWNRDDDPADGANPDWLTSKNIWGGPEGGGPLMGPYTSEVEALVLDSEKESKEIKKLRKICEKLLGQGKLTFDEVVNFLDRYRVLSSKITTKTVRQIINEYL